VKLVNLDNLTLIGSGSEWFWTMVSGIVVAVTFVLIARQLQAQAAANALQRIETVHGRWGSSEMVLARLEVALALREKRLDIEDTRVDVILGFFEMVRALHRQGYLGREEIAEMFGAPVLVWWRLLGPMILEQRSLEGDHEMWSGPEQLAELVTAFDRRRGVDREMIRTMPIEALLASVIKRETLRLQLARDAASGVIPTGVDAPVVATGALAMEPAVASEAEAS